MDRSRESGFSLLETLVVLVIIGILLSSALPRFDAYLLSLRLRAALNQIGAEVYHARVTAARSGWPSYLIFRSTAGCITSVDIRTDLQALHRREFSSPLEARSFCLRHSGDSILVFNGRGMLRPPARSIYSTSPQLADSVLISIAGRVRRNF